MTCTEGSERSGAKGVLMSCNPYGLIELMRVADMSDVYIKGSLGWPRAPKLFYGLDASLCQAQ